MTGDQAGNIVIGAKWADAQKARDYVVKLLDIAKTTPIKTELNACAKWQARVLEKLAISYIGAFLKVTFPQWHLENWGLEHTAIRFVFPNGTEFGVDNAKWGRISGEDMIYGPTDIPSGVTTGNYIELPSKGPLPLTIPEMLLVSPLAQPFYKWFFK